VAEAMVRICAFSRGPVRVPRNQAFRELRLERDDPESVAQDVVQLAAHPQPLLRDGQRRGGLPAGLRCPDEPE
jgi:hypothetical protein